MTDTRTATFSIPANKTYTFDKNLRKLNKKAVVARADSKFTATFSDPYPRSIQIEGHDGTGTPKSIKVMFVDVEVTGPDFAIGDHTLVTMADFENIDEPMFSDFDNSVGFTGYREITRECQHCNTSRPRRKMFVLLNNETGEFVQVGKSCLKDYLGHSIFDAIKGCNLWTGLVDFEDDLMKDFRSTYDFGESLDYVVAVAVHSIENDGYVSRAEAEEKWIKATADRVKDLLNSNYKPTEDEKAEAAAVIEWANAEFVEKFADCTDGTNGTLDTRPSDSFTITMQTLLENGRVANRQTGFAACLPSLKARAEAKAARDAVAGQSEHFGEIKKRMTIDVEVVSVNYIDGYYGTTTLYTMIVDGKNIAKWFSSNDVLDKGERYTLKATVKDHDEYNGTKQTVLTRCAVQ